MNKLVTASQKQSYRKRELEISTTPIKAKSREPACSRAFIQNKIDRRGQERFRVRQSDSYGVWSCNGEGGREKRMNQN